MAAARSFDPNSVMRTEVRRLKRAFRDGDAEAAARLEVAQAALQRRTERAPVPGLDAPLPITDHLDEIRSLLEGHQVVIVAGETGSGKTTQLPQLCVAAGFGRRGMIGHTQPRRLAARTVARRVADELGVVLGDEVGYAVRFDDKVSPDTLVKVLTDGLLLTEIRRDRFLDRYDVLIIDEAHERSLNVDFLLGYLKGLLPRRRDLKLIITSATIDVDAFAGHFGGAPIVEVGGRGYPVDVIYAEEGAELDPEARLAAAIDAIAAEPRGPAQDVLVFQSGEREIFETSRMLRDRFAGTFDILPLYARLSNKEQNRVFAPSQRRRIVVATNIAETSLTVPNIGYVVDPGEARISRYSFRSKLQRLPVEAISKASADQRMGRCGRVAPGVCFRLYSEADYTARPDYTDPEIRRTNLASVALQMQAFGLGEIETFPFLDLPDPGAVRDARKLLEELGALVEAKLTRVGRQMARLPVDPRLARMLIEASRNGSLREVLIIVSGLAIPEPRERPLEGRDAADRLHAEFDDERSDFLTLMKLWEWHEEARQNHSRNGLRRACQARFLSGVRMREWRELHRQLLLSCRDMGMRLRDQPAPYAEIHAAILTGSLSLVGQKQERGEFLGARQLKFRVFPGSGVKKAPRWLMAAEIAETRRVYARCVASVEPAWIERAGQHLVSRSHSEPHWSEKRGETLCFEKVSLFGLVLVEKRRVSLKSLDRDQARAVFLKDGLVPGALRKRPPFLEHNLTLVREIHELEAKGRRRDLLVDDAVLAAFYDSRLEPGVCDVASLDAWRKKAEQSNPNLLFMTRDDVLLGEHGVRENDFPSSLDVDGIEMALRYAFAPGQVDDGVTLQVPIGCLSALRASRFDWLVPGFFENVVEQLLRGLPKSLRRALAPLADKVTPLCNRMVAAGQYGEGRIELVLTEQLKALHGVDVPATGWDWDRVDVHLRMNFQVRDESGKPLRQSRDLDALVRELSAPSAEDETGDEHTETGLTEFPDGGIESHVLLGSGANRRIAYPALQDDKDHVARVLCASVEEANRTSARGLSRLLLMRNASTARSMVRELKSRRQLALHFAGLGDWDELREGVLHAAARLRFLEGDLLPQSKAEFDALYARRCHGWFEFFGQMLEQLEGVLAGRFALKRQFTDRYSPAFEAAATAVQRQLDRLLPADFLDTIPAAMLADAVRYVDGMAYRWDHLQGRVDKDAEGERLVRAFEDRLDAVETRADGPDWELRHVLEELRIGTFAQAIGTRHRVSAKRVTERLETAERAVGIR